MVPVINITGDTSPTPATSNTRATATIQSGLVRFRIYNIRQINKARFIPIPRTKEVRGKDRLIKKFKYAVVVTGLVTRKIYDSLGEKMYIRFKFISIIFLLLC